MTKKFLQYLKFWNPLFFTFSYSGFKIVFVVVVSSKLSCGRTFENVMSGSACLIDQFEPNYDE